MNNDKRTSPENQASLECIACDDGTAMVPELRPGRWRCPQCKATLYVPREFGVETGMIPHRVRQHIVERLPFHINGTPIVKMTGGRP